MKKLIYSIYTTAVFLLFTSQVFSQSVSLDQKITSNQKEITISLFPMPTDGILHISFNKSLTEVPSLLVYDMIGNLVDNISIDRESASSFTINLSGKKAGFYFVKVHTDTESFSRRITVRP